MSIAAANRTVEWIREKLDVLRGCCDQCDIGYTCATLEGFKLPRDLSNCFQSFFVESCFIRKIEMRQFFSYLIVDDVTIEISNNLKKDGNDAKGDDGDEYDQDIECEIDTHKEAQIQEILDNATAAAEATPNSFRELLQGNYSSSSMPAMLVDLLLYFCSANIYRIRFVYQQLIEIRIEHIEISKNRALFRGCSVIVGKLHLTQSVFDFELNLFDFWRVKSVELKLPPVHLHLTIDHLVQVMHFSSQQNSTSALARNKLQKKFRQLQYIKKIRLSYFRERLKKHCKDFQKYKKLHSSINSLDIFDSRPIHFCQNDELGEKDERINDSILEEQLNVWDIKREYNKLQHTLSPQSIADFRHFIEFSRPLNYGRKKLEIHVMSSEPITCAVDEIAQVQFKWNGGLDFDKVSVHVKNCVKVNIEKIRADGSSLYFDQCDVTDECESGETATVLKNLSLQFNTAQHELVMHEDVETEISLNLIQSVKKVIETVSKKYRRRMSTLCSTKIAPNTSLESSDEENFWRKFRIKCSRIYIRVPDVLTLNVLYLTKSNRGPVKFNFLNLSLLEPNIDSKKFTNITLKQAAVLIDDRIIHIESDSAVIVWDPEEIVAAKIFIGNSFKRSNNLKANCVTPDCISSEEDTNTTVRKISLEIMNEFVWHLNKSGRGVCTPLFSIHSEQTQILYDSSQIQIKNPKGARISHGETSFYKDFLRMNSALKITYSFADKNGEGSGLDMQGNGLRIIYLHQLFQELMDYFYQGILGEKIFDSFASCAENSLHAEKEAQQYECASSPKKMSLSTSFTPCELILPVSYTSQQNVRFYAADGMQLKNWFTEEKLNLPKSLNYSNDIIVPYNNALITLSDIFLFNDQSTRLSSLKISMKWFLGGDASHWCNVVSSKLGRIIDIADTSYRKILADVHASLTPKWKVRLSPVNEDGNSPGSVELYLPRDSWYAFKGFIDWNVGEEVRYTEGSIWEDLYEIEKLHPFNDWENNCVFKFGESGLVPTTYDVTMETSCLTLLLEHGGQIRFNDFVYCISKSPPEHFTKQTFTGKLSLTLPKNRLSIDRPIMESHVCFNSISNNTDLIYTKKFTCKDAEVYIFLNSLLREIQELDYEFTSTAATIVPGGSENISIQETLSFLYYDFLDYFTGQSSIEILSLEEVQQDWIQVDDLSWYNSKGHQNTLPAKVVVESELKGVIGRLENLRPKNKKWQFVFSMPQFQICSLQNTSSRLKWTDRSLHEQEIEFNYDRIRDSSPIGQASMNFQYTTFDDEVNVKEMMLTDCSLLTLELVGCELSISDNSTDIKLATATVGNLQHILEILGIDFEIPLHLDDISVENISLKNLKNGYFQISATKCGAIVNHPSLFDIPIKANICEANYNSEKKDMSIRSAILTTISKKEGHTLSAVGIEGFYNQGWSVGLESIHINHYLKVSKPVFIQRIGMQKQKVRTSYCYDISFPFVEVYVEPLIKACTSLSNFFTSSNLSTGNNDNGKGVHTSSIPLITFGIEDMVAKFPFLNANDPYRSLKLQKLLFSHSTSMSSFNFPVGVIHINRPECSEMNTILDTSFTKDLLIAVDVEYCVRLFDHLTQMFIEHDSKSNAPILKYSSQAPEKRSIQLNIQTKQVGIELCKHQVLVSKVLVEQDTTNENSLKINIPRISFIDKEKAHILVDVSNISKATEILTVQEVLLTYGDWESFVDYILRIQQSISESHSFNDLFSSKEQKRNSKEKVELTTSFPFPLIVKKLQINPIQNMSFYGMIHLLKNKVHFQDWRTIVHHGESEVNGDNYQLTQPISITVEIGLKKRVHIPGMRFSITFDDLKLFSDVMDRVKCDFHNRYFSLYNSIKSYGARRKCCHQSSLDSSEQEVSYLSLHVDYLHWIVRDRSNNGLLLRYTVTDINMQYTDADETISSDESIESAQTLQIHNTVLCNESNTFSFSLEFTPEISYYNVRNALFEPFLEPSRLIFQAVQGKQYDRNIRLSFDDTSMECVTDNVGGLRLNLSDAAIEVLARSYAYGCQSFQGQNNSTPCWESIFSTLSINLESAKKFEGQDSQSRIRLILKNNTGVSLKFRLSSKKGSPSPSSSSSIKLPILPENQISLAPISSTMNASSSVATLKKGMVYHVPPESNHDICVSSSQSLAIKVQNGEEVKGVKCDRIGTMIRRVRFQRQGLQPIKEESSKITLPIRFAIDRLPQRNISISSTVTLSNLGYGFLECGVRFDSENGVQNDIECVGTTPLALPLHYFFEEMPFELFVRPPKGSYHWSKNSLLRYSRINSSDVFHWTFMHNMLVCLSMDSYCSEIDESEYKNSIMFFAKAQITDDFVDVKICPSLSIRNLLPLPIEFQICNREKYNADKNKDVPIQMIKLDPGECSDISEGAVRNSVSDQCGLCIHRWLKLGMRGFWSDRWIEVKFDGEISQQNEDGTISSDNNTGIPDYGIQNRSATIPFYNGSQYRVGIKLLPKHDFPSLEDKSISKAFVSIEVIIFADVWIKDLTNLDLIVGTPPPLAQEGFNVSFGSDAEAAILELTNVLEGRKLNEMNSQSNILPLPNQTAGKVIDEVFEYIEIGTNKSPLSQLIKRRWYATERHDCAAVNPKEFILPEENDRSVWKWDGPWTVDLQGANLAEGGWESANAVDTWNPKRIFSSRENFRRRRWRRSRSRARTVEVSNVDSELEVVAHHSNINQKVTGIPIALKLGDGSWSPTFQCSESGIVRVLGMKWRALNTARSKSRQSLIYDLCYVSSPISGIWGEFTNILSITPRILIRNNSEVYSMEIKQVGDIDEKLVLNPGKSAPFFWSSLKGPELICIRPFHYHGDVESHIAKDIYFWSGGIDPCNLGITALRVRTGKNSVSGSNELRTIRANISIRPRSHNTGIDITLKEEAADGTGALFRIENRTPFPLWTAQEGLMANPSSLHSFDPNSESTKDLIDQINLEMAGDCVSAGQSVSFGLDDPSRQVKHGRGSTYLRVALAPLRTRDGLDTTKLIKLKVGDNPIHMKPSQLSESLDHAVCEELLDTKVLGVVVADGPTRVVRFCLIYKDVPASQVLSYAAKRQAKRSEAYLEAMGLIKSTVNPSDHKLTMEKMTDSWIKDGALKAIELKISNSIPNDSEAIEYAKTNTGIFTPNDTPTSISFEFRYNVRISLPELLLSLIDQEPSEVAVLTLQSINMLSKWNQPQNEGVVITISVGWVQIDNHCPNAPFPVALVSDRADDVESNDSNDIKFPALAINVDFTRKRIHRMTCIRNITVVSSNIAMGIDLSFLARLQRYFLGILDWIEQAEEEGCVGESDSTASWIYADTQQIWPLPKMQSLFNARKLGHSESSEIFFERLTIFPCCISFSVTPSRSLSSAEAKLEGPGAAAIHTAVRKGDLRFTANSGAGLLGVKIGRTNRSTLAVVRGIFKSIFVDALLRCEEASIALPGIRIQNYLSTVPQVTTYMLAHYLTALRSNVPSLIFSLAAFGNPSGLIRGLGDGVADFVTEPYKGLKKSLEELDPTFVIDGVARGTGSLARRAIGGVADSASLLTQTLSKNMAVLSLDRKYAQKRDRTLINQSSNGEAPTLIDGLGSGSAKLIKGVYDGVSGVVRAPIRGAEKSGAEGFAKGVGKGLLGLVVKPVVGLSDAATDIMIGVKGSVEGGTYSDIGRKVDTMKRVSHLRTRRVFYGKHRIMRNYNSNDSIAAQLMMNTRLAGEHFSSCVDMGDRGVILLSVNRLLVLVVDQNNNSIGKETACCIKYRNIAKLEARQIPTPDKVSQWSVVFLLKNPRKDGSEVEVIACADRDVADELYGKILHACSEKYLTLTHSKKF